jgi:hypothetical protein
MKGITTMIVRRFATIEEFKNYLADKYESSTAERIFTSIDAWDGVVTHTFWIQTKCQGIAFSEAHADLCVREIWE